MTFVFGMMKGLNQDQILYMNLLRIIGCTFFLVFITENSLGSPHVRNEIEMAFNKHRNIIPIMLEDDVVIPDTIQYYIGSIQQVNGRFLENDLNLAEKLIQILPDSLRDTMEIENGVLKRVKDGISDIVIPEEVKVIGNSVFRNQTSLEKVILSEGVVEIGESAFRNCINLKHVSIPRSVDFIRKGAFRGCIKLQDVEFKDIDDNFIEFESFVFRNCPSLVIVNLPNQLGELSVGLFESCTKLKHIKLPDKLNIISERAFANCESLQSIDCPDTVAKIRDLAFALV